MVFPFGVLGLGKDISKILDNLANQLGVPFNTKSTGFTVANQLGIINDTTSKLTADSWNELWDQGSEEDKAIIVWNYIIVYTHDPKGDHYSKSKFTLSTYLNLAQYEFPQSSSNYNFNEKKHSLKFVPFLIRVNKIFFDVRFGNVDVTSPTWVQTTLNNLGATPSERNKKLSTGER